MYTIKQPTANSQQHRHSSGLRLYNLDYLRGLSAFGIMIYHYLSWSFGNISAETFFGKIGVYGVSIFYVLSGLTLFYVYYDKMQPTRYEVIDFFIKRIFRIFPLLWLVTFGSIILSRTMPHIFTLLLNLSGLFGFIKWDAYLATGAWSIGNELVFYIFFPFFVLFAKTKKPILIILSVILFLIYLYFAFYNLNPEFGLSEQWKNYINPLNQVFLFLGGFSIGLVFHNIKINQIITIILLIIGLVPFIFIPSHGDTITLVTSKNRILFTMCCFLICFCFFKLSLKLPFFIHKPLTLLGEASYSVYLIHPLVWSFTGIISRRVIYFPRIIFIIFSICITLAVSYFVYIYFEKYFMRLGTKIIIKYKKKIEHWKQCKTRT